MARGLFHPPYGVHLYGDVGLRAERTTFHDPSVPRFCGRFLGRLWLTIVFASVGARLCLADGDEGWFVRVWKMTEGLPGDYVSNVVETPDGFLWIGAGAQLERFDGMTLTHSRLAEIPEASDGRIREFVATRDGGMALLLFDGVIVRVNGTQQTVVATGLPHTTARGEAMLETPDGGFIVVHSDESVWRARDGKVTQLSEDDGLPPGSHGRFITDAAGRIWFSKGDYVGIAHGDRFVTLHHFPDGSNPHVAAARDGGVWIGAGARLFRCDEGQALRLIATLPLKNVPVRPNVLKEDSSGAVWVGTYSSGLFRFDGTRFESVPVSHRQITCLTEDHEGNLWVGTSGGGLNEIQPRAVTVEGGEAGLPYEAVLGLAEDDDGQLWGFNQSGLLVARRDGAWKPTPEISPRGAVSAIATGPDNTLWIATKNNLIERWRGGRLTTWSRADGVAPSGQQRLLTASRRGDLWLGSSRPGVVQRLRDGQIKTFELPRPAASVNAMTEDSAGDIWIAASGSQLLRIGADDRMMDESAKLGGMTRPVRLLLAERDGSLWFGFNRGGVGRLKGDSFGVVTTKEGMINDNIEVMLSDARGWLWFVAGEAIFKVAERDLAAVIERRARRVQPVRYGQEEGIRPIFGESVGPIRRRDGKIWIPLATSLAIIDPAQQRAPAAPPPVWITEVRTDGKVVAQHHGVLPLNGVADVEHTELRLPPEHRRLDIDFTALSYRIPTNVLFQYRLENFDDHWIEAGPRRNVSYSRLAAGDYRFRLRACNSDGIWNDTGATLNLVVDPFFWDTWWFRAVVGAAFTVIVFATSRYISNRRLRKQLRAAEQAAAVERERARIARDIHDDLGSRLTKIVLLTGLVARDRAEPDRASERVQEISETARQLIKSLDETVWAVNPRNDTLPHLISYIGQFAVNFLRTAEIGCHLELPDDPPALAVSAEVRHHVFLAVKEALTNVVRHARATTVALRVTATNGPLEISISDNGVGFVGDPDSPEADGLGNMRQRMAQIGGTVRVESGTGTGTRVIFTLPRLDTAEV